MSRRRVCILILVLFILAFFPVSPVSAADEAGPDTSGFDLDIGAYVTDLMDNPFMAAAWGPPRYQWSPERYMDEGDRCAEKLQEYHTRFTDRGYVLYQQAAARGGFTPANKDIFSYGLFTDPDGVFIGIVRNANDPEADQYYQKMESFGSCVEKNYNAAMDMQKNDDYGGKAAVWDRAAQMFEMLGNDKAAERSRNKAEDYRDAANADSLLAALLPLPAGLAVLGIAGGFLLLRRRI